MITLTRCPCCESGDLERVRDYAFERPAAPTWADCSDYFERRRWILFEHVLPGRNTARFRLLHCRACDLLFTDPRFDDDEIGRKYRALVELGSTAHEYAGGRLAGADRRARRIHRLVARWLPPVRPSGARRRIADVGGQFGHNLKHFPADAFEKYVIDYEEHGEYDDLTYLKPDWATLDRTFDVLLTNHTVEHLSFPTRQLREQVAHLADDGIVYVEVPLGAFREAYHLKEPLTHFNFYSERSLANQAEQAGLEPLHVDTTYQWVTDHAEHCINLIARRRGAGPASEVFRGPLRSSREARRHLPYYLPLVAKRLIGRDAFAR
jgi:hypothetical protein